MRIASRHMPKFKPRPIGFAAWILLAAVGAGLAYAVASAPVGATAALLLLCGAFVWGHRVGKRREEQLRRLAATREGQSICEFARDFEIRTVDTWIIRAVYEQVQRQLRHVHPAFPVRAGDRLKEDLFLDDDDLDMDVAPEVEQRTGRSLDNSGANPHFGKVRTVRDLVLFFQSQPVRSAA